MTEMTSRERFARMFEHKEADRIPIIDDPWGSTIERWQREGMPDGVNYVDFFDLDRVAMIAADNSPRYEETVIEETDEYRTVTTKFGVTVKNWKHAASTPQFLDFTIVDPESWAAAKERIRPDRDRINWKYLEHAYPVWQRDGYWLARLRWPGREYVFYLLVATMMLPFVVTLIPTFILFKYLRLLDTLWPLFLPSWFGAAFYIFLMRQFMIGLPFELEEAARIDGAGSLRILVQVIAPLCGPAIATVAIFAFLAHYNDFMGPLIYLSTNERFTLPLGIYWYQGRYGTSWHLVMAVSTVALVPVIALFFVAQRYFIRGIALSGLAGR